MNKASLIILVSRAVAQQDIDNLLQAACDHDMHMSFLVVEPFPRPPLDGYGMHPYGVPLMSEVWQVEIDKAEAYLKKTAQMIEARLSVAGCNGDADILGCEASALPDVIGRRAATCDAVVVSDSLRDDDDVFRNACHGVLFQSPVGLFVNPVGPGVPFQPKHVFIAWNGGLPAARAVHAALPLLKQAEDLTIGVFDPATSPERDSGRAGSELARWLSHHGCHVDLQQYPSGGEEIGNVIAKRAAEIGAEMVVMGAYGHSRMREAVFGGTTRTMIGQTKMPLLLAH